MTTLDPGGASVYRVAGRTYPLKFSPGCGVCKSKFRTVVENMLCQGMSPPKVASELALMVPEPEQLSVYQVRNHLRPRGGDTHIPHLEEVRRAIIEKRFTELQIDPEAESARAIDHVGFLRLVVNEAIDYLLTRNLKIRTISEALAAVMDRMLAKKPEDRISTAAEAAAALDASALRPLPGFTARLRKELLHESRKSPEPHPRVARRNRRGPRPRGPA